MNKFDNKYFEGAILNIQDYYAHLPNSSDLKEKTSESLLEHISLVTKYAEVLIEKHRLNFTISSLLQDCIPKQFQSQKIISDVLDSLFWKVIVFHDYGKVNHLFQQKRMESYKDVLKVKHDFNSQHSIISTYIFLADYYVNTLDLGIADEERVFLDNCALYFSYSIIKHHSSYLGDVKDEKLWNNEKLFVLSSYLILFKIKMSEEDIKNFHNYILKCAKYEQGLFEQFVEIYKGDNPFPLFVLIKLNYSLLTAADYLATHEYMNSDDNHSAKTEDFGVLAKRERVEEIIRHLQSYSHNAATYADLEDHNIVFPEERTKNNLNLLRKQMAIEVVRQVRQNTDARLFYLEAPTGGGKTNLAALIIGELFAANGELNKAFLVFPFTTLITQTFGFLKSSMGLRDDEIVELHSKAAFTSKDEQNKEKTEDGFFGDEKKDFIDNLFALYPITLMSHVKFFDILKTNSKEANYLLHRLANSVVVIDELQSYNPAIWDKMLYFIDQYAHYFNIRFILMSATLPKISNLKVGFKEPPSFIELLPNAHRYITNINFSGRVKFEFALLDRGKIDLETLSQSVVKKSEEYANKYGSVKTIVEFIYKKSASAFQRLFRDNKFYDKIFVLSGTILESRRREVINYIKRTVNEKKNILLITTQVVEAGVDIDMDLGFKNVSLLDSDEQLAGRVNRNAGKDYCEVYLFDMDDAQVLYGKDYRYEKTKEMSLLEKQEILDKKDFRKLYEKVLLSIDDSNNPIFQNSISSYKSHIKDLRYRDVDREFKIIDQNNNSIFVPLYIPICVEGAEEGKTDEIFTKEDLSFLDQFNIFSEKYEFDGEYREAINGAKVWEAYKEQIEHQAKNRKEKSGFNIQMKIEFKTLQSIMAKFCFSLVSHSKDYYEMQKGFGQEEYGFFYFSYYDKERENGKPYNYKTGLNTDAFSDSSFI